MLADVDPFYRLPREIRVPIVRRSHEEDGRMGALRFVMDCDVDMATIQEEIQETIERITNPSEELRGAMAPNSGPRMYQDGYLAGLQDSVQILQAQDSRYSGLELAPFPAPTDDPNEEYYYDPDLPAPLKAALVTAFIAARGRMEAFDFTQDALAASNVVRAQIAAVEAQPGAVNPLFADGLPAPLADAYRDSYLAGLREALAIIGADAPGRPAPDGT